MANVKQKIAFRLEGRPLAWARARVSGTRFFKSADQAAYQQYVAQVAAVAAQGLKFEGPIAISAIFYFERPKAHLKLKDKPIYMSSRPDCDNLVKQVGDSLNGVVFTDDAQIVRILSEKKFTDIGGAYSWIEIEEV